jgi:hypothetical protein
VGNQDPRKGQLLAIPRRFYVHTYACMIAGMCICLYVCNMYVCQTGIYLQIYKCPNHQNPLNLKATKRETYIPTSNNKVIKFMKQLHYYCQDVWALSIQSKSQIQAISIDNTI